MLASAGEAGTERSGESTPGGQRNGVYEPRNPLWEKVRLDVANRLVAENAYVLARWVDALRPMAHQLRDPLAAIFRDTERSETERTLAASALPNMRAISPMNWRSCS